MTHHAGTPAATDSATDSAAEPDTWRRVSPRFIRVEVISIVIGVSVMLLATIPLHLFVSWVAWVATAAILLGASISFIITPRRVRAIGFRLRADDLVFRKGIMFHRQVAVPYGRMQLIDINRGPLLRGFGLSELKFVTAAAATGVTIPGLPEAEAETLRDELVALAETRRAGL